MRILIIDAQGGGLGKQLIAKIRKELPEVYITAVGTNVTATGTMLKAGADEAATGENAVCVCVKKADYIIGPLGIVIADAMLGEITADVAAAVAQASAKRILIPFSSCDTYIAGSAQFSTGQLVANAVEQLKKELSEAQ
ncbi:MAG: DUF3842 family protein [Solobacterium sp.]|nr:DUF3842 family protein [Solobacterium sp.]